MDERLTVHILDLDLVVSSNPKLQRVVVEVPDHVLAAAAAGPGTTLGQPQ